MRSLREIYDDLHELKIKDAGYQMELAMLRGDKGNAHWWLTEQGRLIGMRSADQVERMEAEMGLL